MTKPIAPWALCAAGLLVLADCKKIPTESVTVPPISETHAEEPSVKNDPLSEGLEWLYNLQYDQARRVFTALAREHPSDPAGYFYLTATDWWQLAQDFELEQPAVTRQFHSDCERTLAVAQALYVKSADPAAKARACFYEGGAWGLKGRWEVTRGHWLDAYHAGKEGHSYLKKAISLDPHLYDAYLGLGIYDYYAETLKGVQALLSSLLMHGDRQRGLQETRIALQKGKHARVEAALFLIDMYTSWEKKPEEALPLAQRLHDAYPQSPAMHLVLISALGANRQWDAVGREADIFLERAEREKPFYTKAFVPAGLYYAGLSALYKGDSKTGIDRMNAVIASPGLSANSRWLTFAWLRKGQAYDLQGKRDRAVKEYKHVLSRPDVWKSQEEAAAGLKSPFKTKQENRQP